jgi:hypothetical protein
MKEGGMNESLTPKGGSKKYKDDDEKKRKASRRESAMSLRWAWQVSLPTFQQRWFWVSLPFS